MDRRPQVSLSSVCAPLQRFQLGPQICPAHLCWDKRLIVSAGLAQKDPSAVAIPSGAQHVQKQTCPPPKTTLNVGWPTCLVLPALASQRGASDVSISWGSAKVGRGTLCRLPPAGRLLLRLGF